MSSRKEESRIRRHKRLRKKIVGTKEKPRLLVHRSLSNMYAQMIDDIESKTLLSISTLDPKVKERAKYGGNVKAAEALGEQTAAVAKTKKISKVVFDRGGYIYHGRIKAFAESAKKHGLAF